MTKWFEVTITTSKVVLVEVDDSEGCWHAVDAASREFRRGENGTRTCRGEHLSADELALARHRADEVLSL
jgi:hypothetical protein